MRRYGPVEGSGGRTSRRHSAPRCNFVLHPTRGKYISVGNPIKLSDSPSEVTRSPLLGEHTDEILRQVLGFSDHQVAEIHDSGALDPPRKQAAE